MFFIRLRNSLCPSLLRVCIITRCWILSNAFLHLFMWSYDFSCLVWWGHELHRFFLFVCLFSDRVSLCRPGWNAVEGKAHCSLDFLAQTILPPQLPSSWNYKHTLPCPTDLFFIFCRHKVLLCFSGWFELLISIDPPLPTSQRAGITSMRVAGI